MMVPQNGFLPAGKAALVDSCHYESPAHVSTFPGSSSCQPSVRFVPNDDDDAVLLRTTVGPSAAEEGRTFLEVSSRLSRCLIFTRGSDTRHRGSQFLVPRAKILIIFAGSEVSPLST